jgi:cytochrome c oxidase subunit 2
MEQFLGLPPDGSAHGPAIDHLIVLVHWLMLVLFVGWSIFYITTLIRFRKSRNPKANYSGVKSHISSYLEVGVLVIEVILLLGFSIPLWSKRVDAFPAEKDATVVRIVAEQFAWNIHYPGPDGKFGRTSINLIDADNPLGLDRSDPDAKDDITTINQLNLPVNKPVIVQLSTKDVIHSFNLPAFRVKQDAIPGQLIPVWFTPVKTTNQIRDELKKSFSIAEVMKKIRKMSLPQMSKMTVRNNDHMDDMMLMQDFTDSSGSPIVSKGDHLTSDNVTKLTTSGSVEVSVRPFANLDKYVSTEDYKDSSGNIIVAKNDNLSEDAVTKLVQAGIYEVTARPAANMDNYVIMESYQDQGGNPIAAKGDAISDDLLSKLAAANIGEITIAPATPTEIACAQLCGLGHYRMRGYINVQTEEEFKTWMDAQETALNPAPDSSTATPDTTRVNH